MITISMEIVAAIRGIRCLVIAPIPASASLAATKSVPPTGGVYSAMDRFAVITTPKWTMSILNDRASGKSKGALSSMAGNGSMKMPSKSRAILVSKRKTHCWWATLWTHAASCTATCSTVISQERHPVAPITSKTTALVWKDSSSRPGRSPKVRSLYKNIEISAP